MHVDALGRVLADAGSIPAASTNYEIHQDLIKSENILKHINFNRYFKFFCLRITNKSPLDPFDLGVKRCHIKSKLVHLIGSSRGQLQGSITNSKGSHRKVQLFALCASNSEIDLDIFSEDALFQGTTGTLVQPHGSNQGSTQLSEKHKKSFAELLSRVNITSENLEVFMQARVFFKNQYPEKELRTTDLLRWIPKDSFKLKK